jgi:hypothetical protein
LFLFFFGYDLYSVFEAAGLDEVAGGGGWFFATYGS